MAKNNRHLSSPTYKRDTQIPVQCHVHSMPALSRHCCANSTVLKADMDAYLNAGAVVPKGVHGWSEHEGGGTASGDRCAKMFTGGCGMRLEAGRYRRASRASPPQCKQWPPAQLPPLPSLLPSFIPILFHPPLQVWPP